MTAPPAAPPAEPSLPIEIEGEPYDWGDCTPLERLFVSQYLIDLNPTRAVKRTGYPAPDPRIMGDVLMARPRVRAAINALIDRRARRTVVSQERVIAEIAKIAFANIVNYIRVDDRGQPVLDLSDAGPDEMAALAELKILESTDQEGVTERRALVKLAAKLPALELLGKHLGMFKDKVPGDGAENSPLVPAERRERVAYLIDQMRARGLLTSAQTIDQPASFKNPDAD